jgi:Zn-dependent M28 family amino/carboxypeptidase
MQREHHPKSWSILVAGCLILTGALSVSCRTPVSAPEEEMAADADLVVPSETETAADAVTREILSRHTERLAADEMEGRGPGSAGDQLARQYLSTSMEALGLEPAFGDKWEQAFDLIGIEAQAPEIWRFAIDGEPLELAFWEDYIAGSGVQQPAARIQDAEVVFVGYGIQAPEYDWDDYKGAELAGKVLLMLNNDPDWEDQLFEGETRLYYGRWDYKYESAAAQGAAGAIIIHTTPSAGYPWQVVQTSWTGPQFELPARDEARLQIAAWVTEDAARRVASLAGRDLDELVAAARARDFRPVALGVTTSLHLENSLETVEGANVGGLLPGSDPRLRDEVVVYTAHHDHLGLGQPDDTGDNIYNGARDNASGCAQVLAIAEAFTALPEPPPRSVLFLFVAAEEQGLLGSQYYAENPSFSPARIAANLNLDGGNIWGATRDVTYIGYGKSSLDRVFEAAAAWQGRTVKGDQFPDRGYFYRSDQFNFAKIGVPAIYIDNGTEFVDRPPGWGKQQIEAWEEIHYHQPSDEFSDDWDFAGIIEDARLMFAAGLMIASQEELPSWRPGDEFEAARREALAALE